MVGRYRIVGRFRVECGSCKELGLGRKVCQSRTFYKYYSSLLWKLPWDSCLQSFSLLTEVKRRCPLEYIEFYTSTCYFKNSGHICLFDVSIHLQPFQAFHVLLHFYKEDTVLLYEITKFKFNWKKNSNYLSNFLVESILTLNFRP